MEKLRPIESVLEEFDLPTLHVFKNGNEDCVGNCEETIMSLVKDALLQRDQEWLKRIEEIDPGEMDTDFEDYNLGWNECRQEVLNNIKEL